MTIRYVVPFVFAAKQHFTKPPYIKNSQVLQRVSWIEADFFDAAVAAEELGSEAAARRPEDIGVCRPSPHCTSEIIPDADLYVMTRILHDW
jgi:hypothetical protein